MTFSNTVFGCCIFIVVALIALSSRTTTVDAQLTFTPSAGKTYKVGYCNICGGDGYLLNPNDNFQNGSRQWTCGYAQTTVQDVSITATDSEKIHCTSTALIAQEGGCRCSGGITVQDKVNNPGEACDLCGRGQPIANRAALVNTGVAGSHQCGTLADYMLGGFSASLCPTIKVNAFKTCCIDNVIQSPNNDYTISFNSGSGGGSASAPTPQYNTAKQSLRGNNRQRAYAGSGGARRGGAGSF